MTHSFSLCSNLFHEGKSSKAGDEGITKSQLKIQFQNRLIPRFAKSNQAVSNPISLDNEPESRFTEPHKIAKKLKSRRNINKAE